ncbi:MAG: acyltransferase family protein [Sinobacterium sp.]
MSNRIKLIDVAKGISIIMVVFSHTKLTSYIPDVHQAMSLFRMPLFFFLSGVFFSVSTSPAAYIARKSEALLKPYFVTLFIMLFISALSGQEAILWQIKGVLYGNGVTIGVPWAPLWFLTHLWCLFITAYFLFHYTSLQSRSNFIKIFFTIIMVVAGSYSVDTFWYLQVPIANSEIELPGLPFSMDIIPLSMAFFITGAFLNKNIRSFKPDPFVFMVSICAFVLIAINTGAVIDLNRRVYTEPAYATFAAITGIYIILSISYGLCKSPILTRGVIFFGTASLFILIFHMVISEKTYHVLNYLSGSNYQFACAFVAFIASIIVPVFIQKHMLRNAVLKRLYFPLKSYGAIKK